MKNLFSLVIIAGILATLWWMMSTQRDTLLQPGPPQQHGIDAYMDDFTMNAMGSDGLPALTIRARRMLHYSDSKIAELETPDILINDTRNTRWRITADLGEIDSRGSQVKLRSNVSITGTGTPDPITITTDSLSIDIDRQIISTPANVYMQHATTQLQSKGMVIDNREGTLQLLASVRGNHALD